MSLTLLAVSSLYILLVIKFCLLPKGISDLTLPVLSHCCHHSSDPDPLDLEICTNPFLLDFLPRTHSVSGPWAHLPKLGLSGQLWLSRFQGLIWSLLVHSSTWQCGPQPTHTTPGPSSKSLSGCYLTCYALIHPAPSTSLYNDSNLHNCTESSLICRNSQLSTS